MRSERRRLATEGVVYTKHIALMYQVAANGAHEGRRRPWARHRPTRVGTTIASLKTAHCVGQRTIWPCVMASGSAASYRYGPGRVRIARWPLSGFRRQMWTCSVCTSPCRGTDRRQPIFDPNSRIWYKRTRAGVQIWAPLAAQQPGHPRFEPFFTSPRRTLHFDLVLAGNSISVLRSRCAIV